MSLQLTCLVSHLIRRSSLQVLVSKITNFLWVIARLGPILISPELYAQYMKPKDNLVIIVLVASGGVSRR